jgi:photosystem II stability/assembly factor-like uncharacterized protein
MFGNLEARQIGPAVMSGRISCITSPAGQPEVAYVGAAGGGIWKTNAAGANMLPIFDDHTMSIGDIAVAPSNTDHVWVGTGEQWPRNSVSVGNGVYRSTDAGLRWKHLGLEKTERIADVVIHPTDENTVYVAALGQLWGPNEERGVFKTTDGGESWEKVLYIDENTGAADLSLDVNNPEVLYASMWSFRRRPFTFDSGFTGTSGLYKTTDGGAKWEELSIVSDEKLGRIAVAVAPSNSQMVYASVETGNNDNKGFYRSEDGGATWTLTDQSFNTYVRPFYFSEIEVDPSNDSIVAKAGYTGIISKNAGNSFSSLDGRAHPDFHDIWINPENGQHIRVATDGGVFESYDQGKNLRMWQNIPVSQFYHVSVDHHKPYNVYGGLQDNGSWFGPSREAGGIGNASWEKTYGGDGFYSFRHPDIDHIVFSEYQGGMLVRFDTRTRQAKNIAPYASGEEEKLRWNWNSPLHLSQDGKRLYFAAQYLYRSGDNGDSWDRVSSDLTTNVKAQQQQQLSGGLSIDNSTAENYNTIYSIAESPVNKNVLWVGSDDGLIHLSQNAGKDWEKVSDNISDYVANPWITFIEASPHDPMTAFVTADAHRNADMSTYVYKTTDGGKSWAQIATKDVEGYALSIRQDPVNPDLVFLGTEFGLYISLDGGDSWARFQNGVPKVGVRDMVIQPDASDLVMATHGRGVIILDDVEALRQLTPEVTSQDLVFLEVQDNYLSDGNGASGGDYGGAGMFVGPNPSTQARIMYFAGKRHTFGKMYIEVYRDGELIKTLPAGKSGGLNIVTMPVRLPKPKTAPTKARTALFGSANGPAVPLGEYQVKLIKGRKTYESAFTLSPDPDSPYGVEERENQRKAMLRLYDTHETLAWQYDVLKNIEAQLKTSGSQKLPKKLSEQLNELKSQVTKLKGTLLSLEGDGYTDETTFLREELGNLYYAIASFPGQPSDSQMKEADRLIGEINRVDQQVGDILNKRLVSVNEQLAKRELATVVWTDKDTFLASEDESVLDQGPQQGPGLKISKQWQSIFSVLQNTGSLLW